MNISGSGDINFITACMTFEEHDKFRLFSIFVLLKPLPAIQKRQYFRFGNIYLLKLLELCSVEQFINYS